MENASKALLIAAGIFFGLLILTLCVYMFSQLTNYFTQTEEERLLAQITKFNSEYEKYADNDVRGNDLLSLINKIVDYNARQADVDGIRYERMIITIDVRDTSSYLYDGATGSVKYNKEIIKNCNNINNDNDIYSISNAVDNMEGKYKKKQLQNLTSNISNLFAPYEYPDPTSPSYLQATQKRNSLVKDIIGTEYDDLTNNNKQILEKAALEYYQYQQFKRAHFECTGTTYNQQTGRIVRLEFKFTGKIE